MCKGNLYGWKAKIEGLKLTPDRSNLPYKDRNHTIVLSRSSDVNAPQDWKLIYVNYVQLDAANWYPKGIMRVQVLPEKTNC